MQLNYKVILNELDQALNTSDFTDLQSFVDKISSASNIVVFGAGRVGLMMKTLHSMPPAKMSSLS